MASKITMTAAEVKQALRKRHPAEAKNGPLPVPGPWTVLEEWMEIDLLAISANAQPGTGAKTGKNGARYPRVGYEVKVSRSDLRSELLKPGKRMRARAFCHELYLAVPKGLLKPEEIAFEEPAWFDDLSVFQRARCPNNCWREQKGYRHAGKNVVDSPQMTAYREACGHHLEQYGAIMNKRWDRNASEEERAAALQVPAGPEPPGQDEQTVICLVCNGRGYTEKSRVEQEAPTLWVPRDLGLVEVDGRGCRVVKASPVNLDATLTAMGSNLDQLVGDLVRWTSVRRDERHAGLVERTRSESKQLRDRLRD